MKMKKIGYAIAAAILCAGLHACETDNYEAPGETLQGRVSDAAGNGLQLEQGASSARIKMEELSFKNPVPVYLNVKQDGSFINTKVFGGRYRVFPVEGPFFPLDSTQMQLVDISGPATANFKVIPYLNVEWVGDPVVAADKKITVSFKFTRNAAPAGFTQPAPADYQLFISTTQYVGNNNYDNTRVGSVVTATAAMENQVLTITSSQPMKYATTFYLRVGVRVNDSFKKYNYTPVKSIVIP
ncbi:DUF3823 domain-containing protein [Hufsiella ginkgonis]|uniref:DUF3823 domain-containing protein n=1 Tax=Hufsiella ginkgonis TaxID=2695274 RepID=A0A7K1Y3H7_9SPHI|nr:DUF3823 domain-containing protein [Hufsiella ginkgonis]MXV17236.1 DUF3823 domain-containing protein [Hufsiella ginkgonis]